MGVPEVPMEFDTIDTDLWTEIHDMEAEIFDINWNEIMNDWNHEDFPIDENGIATQV